MAASSTRPTLLIVDDEPDVRASLEYLLRRGHRVLTAEGGEAALTLLEQEDVQVILCDQRMPGLTGDQVLARAREIQPDAVRIMLTGYADIQAIGRAINEACIFRYVPKPWDAAELELIVRQAVEQHNLVRDRRRLLEELQVANAKLIQANQELAEASALKSAFLEVASHELNTPISIVLGLSHLLLNEANAGTIPDRAAIEQVVQSANHLARLVGSMLKLAHAGDFRNAPRAEPTNLGALAHSVADQLQPFIDRRSLRLERLIEDGLEDVWLDADKIRDAITHLLTNAIKFTPDGGLITLEVRPGEDGLVLIRVRDEGIGLDAQSLEKIFEPFFTEFDTAQHSSGDFGFRKRGLGLGLSLVQKFAQLHGGRVEAQSAPGQGTCISLWLPRDARRQAPERVQ